MQIVVVTRTHSIYKQTTRKAIFQVVINHIKITTKNKQYQIVTKQNKQEQNISNDNVNVNDNVNDNVNESVYVNVNVNVNECVYVNANCNYDSLALFKDEQFAEAMLILFATIALCAQILF